MSPIRFPVALTAILALATSWVRDSTAAESGKPNFVLIFIDDMGYGDIGPFGSKLNRTPNLDRMAAEGMKLTSFYAAPVCSASRAQLMTGCYAPRVSVPGVFFPAGRNGLNPDEHTVADYLGEAGYATMCVGKWHLGDQREFLPVNNGFDGYLGIPYSNDMARPTLEDGRSVHPLVRDDGVAELLENEDQRRITRLYTEEGIKFIEANQKKPFFLYLPHTAMHVPLFPHKDFVGKSKNGTYGDWVEEVDWSVGQILDTLRRLKLAENTLVLFTSDNGPWASKGKAGGVSGPLRGSKGCTLEGGVREPTIAWWPGKVTAGSTSDGIAGTTDVLPTFVSLAGGKTKADRKIDGVDISPLLLGESEESPRNVWHYYQGRTLKAVRSGPWKLALTGQSIGMGFRERPEDLRSPMRLYNLEEEIGELTNVAADNPEIVARLKKLADEMIADIGSGQPGPGVRPAGVVDNPVTLYPTKPRGPRKNNVKPDGKPIDWAKVKIGDVYSTRSAPAIAGKPFTINCKIKGDAKKLSGVIVAHGGSAVGYSLYVHEGKAWFAYRTNSTQIQRVSADLADGETALMAAVMKDTLIIHANNGGSGTGSPDFQLIGMHPQEDLCIGHDDKNPVDEKSPKAKFNGEILALQVAIDKKK